MIINQIKTEKLAKNNQLEKNLKNVKFPRKILLKAENKQMAQIIQTKRALRVIILMKKLKLNWISENSQMMYLKERTPKEKRIPKMKIFLMKQIQSKKILKLID